MERAHWHKQSWPDVLILLLKSIITLALVLTRHVLLSNSKQDSRKSLDSAYFNSEGRLKPYMYIIAYVQLGYAALSLSLLHLSFAISFLGPGSDQQIIFKKENEGIEDDYYIREPLTEWQANTQERIREAVNFCTTSIRRPVRPAAPSLPEIRIDRDPLYSPLAARNSEEAEMTELHGERPGIARSDSEHSIDAQADVSGRFTEEFVDEERRSGETVESSDGRLSTLMEEEEERTNTFRLSSFRPTSPEILRQQTKTEEPLASPTNSSVLPSTRTSHEQNNNEEADGLMADRGRPTSSSTFGRRQSVDGSH